MSSNLRNLIIDSNLFCVKRDFMMGIPFCVDQKSRTEMPLQRLHRASKTAINFNSEIKSNVNSLSIVMP